MSINNRAIVRVSDLRRYQAPAKAVWRNILLQQRLMIKTHGLPPSERVFLAGPAGAPKIFPKQYLNELLTITTGLDEAGVVLVLKAYDKVRQAFAGKMRLSGRPFIDHLVDTALILRTVMENRDPVLLAAGLLHDIIEDIGVTYEELKQEFGAEVADLVKAETKLSKEIDRDIRDLEYLKKLIKGISQDPRVALLKAADNLSNNRDQEVFPKEKQLEHAGETMEIYVPIMDAMGVWEMRLRLEDSALKYRDLPEYPETIALYDRVMAQNKGLFLELEAKIKEVLAAKGFKGGRVELRQRAVSEVFRKMRRSGRTLEDLLAENPLYLHYINVEVNSALDKDVYRAMATLRDTNMQPRHRENQLSGFQPRGEKLLDFVSFPRRGYRALQSSFVKEGLPGSLLITVNNKAMNRSNRLGFAAAGADAAPRPNWYKQSYDWLDKLLNYSRNLLSADEVRELIGEVTYPIIVYTQNGRRVKLPRGATPLDFAFLEEPILAQFTTGARVNGVSVTLNRPLRSNETVELEHGREMQVTPTWLSWVSSTGTAEAIRCLLRTKTPEERRTLALNALNRAAQGEYLNMLNISSVSWLPRFIARLNEKYSLAYKTAPDLIAGVGRGELDPEQVITDFLNFFQELLKQRVAEGTRSRQRYIFVVHTENRVGILKEITTEISRLKLNIDINLASGGEDGGTLFFTVSAYSSLQRDQVRNILLKFGELEKCLRIPNNKFDRLSRMLSRLMERMGEKV